MSAPPSRDASPRVDALVCRMAAGLVLLAAAVFLLTLLAVTRLPLAQDGSGYALPGTDHALDPAIVPVLAWCGGIAALLGCATLALGGWPIRAWRMDMQPKRRSGRRSAFLLIGGAITLAAVLLLKR